MRRLTALALVALIISSVFAREARPVAASSGGPLVPALLPADSTIAASPNPVLAGNRVTVSGSGWPGSGGLRVSVGTGQRGVAHSHQRATPGTDPAGPSSQTGRAGYLVVVCGTACR